MGKKQLQVSGDQPSFQALYRMHEEVLKLRRQVEVEEAREAAAKAKRQKSQKQPDPRA